MSVLAFSYIRQVTWWARFQKDSLSEMSIGDVLSAPSCACDCSSLWSRDVITRARKNLFTVCKSRKNLYLFLETLLRTFYNTEEESFDYIVSGGHHVCSTAFEAFWNITRYCRIHIETAIREGRNLDDPHGNTNRDYENWKTVLVTNWLQSLVNVSEHQPDSDEVHTFECALKQDLYEGMSFISLFCNHTRYVIFYTT